MNIRKLLYVLVWGIVSFLSSFTEVLKGDLSFIKKEDINEAIFAPVLIWAIAFFVDYIYVVGQLNEKEQKLDKSWTIVSYLMILLILLTLLANVYYNQMWWRWTSLGVVYACFMTLKTSSLYVVRPLQRVQKV